jgi:dTDP-4-amino-4,6-dideoxygalactose transaminase
MSEEFDYIEQPTTGNGHKRGRNPIPADETRQEKFVRLALYRMTNLKSSARGIANLAKYPHTDEQRNKIISELRKIVAEIDIAFTPKTRDDNFSF